MYTDCLFTTATSTKRTLSPNPGFTTTRIHSLPGYIDIDCKSAYATITEGKGEEAVPSVQVEVDNQTLNYIGSSESGSMDTGVPDAMESIQSETEKLDLTRDNCDQSQDEDDVIESDAIGDDNEDSEDNKSDGIIKGDDDDDLDDVDDRNDEEISMDMILQRALFRCIKYVIKDHLLPMPVSSLWATVLK